MTYANGKSPINEVGLSARLPVALQGTHFGPTLRSFILYQYHHQRVTQPLLWQQLRDWGIDLSRGQLHRLITEDQTPFHQEKDALLNAGLGVSTYLHVDDTGARHAGKNGYCTHLGNEHFAVFHSTDSKSRINFLQLLRGSHTDSVINACALDYLRAQRLPQMFLAALQQKGHHDSTMALPGTPISRRSASSGNTRSALPPKEP